MARRSLCSEDIINKHTLGGNNENVLFVIIIPHYFGCTYERIYVTGSRCKW
jgi:hypothetical protein